MGSISLGTTDVKMCQRALVNIGVTPIQNLDGDDDITQACTLMYPMVKKEVLTMYPWRSTRSRVQLSRLTATPVTEWKYGFQMAAQRLSGPLAIYSSNEQGAKPVQDWESEGENVLTDYENLWGLFQFDIDESRLPPWMENLIVYILSARLAEPLTEDSSKADKWDFIAYGSPQEKRMGGYFEVCRQIDSRFSPNENIEGGFDLLDVRYS